MESSPDNYELMANDEVQAEIDRLSIRRWDLLEQIREAELTRAALLNIMKDRREAAL